MTGLKTNECPGTRAVAKYVRVSPTKARAVLDLIRGESYGRASEILAFSERAVSEVVGKCLDSAVANAENNDGIPAEELFVSACYADEGPTLKRWRPRARGRATSIKKRTSHITVIVGRYDEATLEDLREREAAKGRAGSSTHAAEARRQRVERSRAAAEAVAAEEADHDHDHEVAAEVDIDVSAEVPVEEEQDEEQDAEEQDAEEQDAEQQDEEQDAEQQDEEQDAEQQDEEESN
jgi:large subunit ribosomal protein L22